MATKVEIIGRGVERLLPLLKERPALRSRAVEVQRWCASATSDAIVASDAVSIVTLFTAAAGEHKDEMIVVTALDALDRLLSHGVITHLAHVQLPAPSEPAVEGEAAAADDASPAKPMNNEPTILQLIIETAASRATGVTEDVQVQVIRLLLTAAAVCEASGSVLMVAVRTIIQVLLSSKGSKSTQQSGKAALSQIAGTVQRRAETIAAVNTGAMRDCAFLLQAFSDLCTGTDITRITLGLTLLHNFVATLDAVLVSQDPRLVDVLRRDVAANLVPLLCSANAQVSKAAFYLLQHLVETFRRALRREIPILLNFLYAICERSSSFASKSLAYGTLVSFAKNPDLLYDMYRNYDCETGTFNVFAQFGERVSALANQPNPTLSLAHDETLKQLALSAVSSLAQSLRRFEAPAEDSVSDAAPTAAAGSSPLRFQPPPPEADFATDTMGYDGLVNQIAEKQKIARVLECFAARPKDGIAMAIEVNLIPDTTPASVARFLRTKGIDKTVVGDYLSANKPHIAETVQEFIHLNDYSGMHIDEAMRLLLGHFKIGGEAQTVDRTMNAFAQRYCEQNPEVFADKDVAYVLAFSIMMLNTDLHSPSIKERMTLAQFFRNNTGINNGQDLPQEMLTQIYHRIRDNEIKLNDDTVTIDEEAVGKIVVKRDPNSIWSPDYCVEKTVNRLKALSEFTVMVRAADARLGNLMFADTWKATLQAVSKLVEDITSPKIIAKAFEALERFAALSCRLGNHAARNEIIEALRKLAKVTSHVNAEQVNVKNVKAIDTIIRVATNEGETLEAAWRDVLVCISKAARVREVLRAKKHDSGKNLTKVEQTAFDALNEGFAPESVETLFRSVLSLSDTAILSLVDGLFFTLGQEIKEHPPRISSFIQLVEVLKVSISRSRELWCKLWDIVAASVAQVIVRLPKVADSIFKVLGKFYDGLIAETGGPAQQFWVTYQREAAQVLWMCAWQTRDSKARAQLMGVVNIIISKSPTRLNEAWLPLARTLNMLARDIEPMLVTSAYVAFRAALLHAATFNDETFATMIGCAISFAAAGNEDVSEGAVSIAELLAAFAQHGTPAHDERRFAELYDKDDFRTLADELPRLEGRSVPRSVVVMDIIVGGLASLVTVQSPTLRTKAVVAAFSVLAAAGDMWSVTGTWPFVICGSIAPMFDHLFSEMESSQAKLDIIVPVLQRSAAMFSTLLQQRRAETSELQGQLFAVVSRCLQHRYAAVADVGVAHLRDWITRHQQVPAVGEFTAAEWNTVAKMVANVLAAPTRSTSMATITRASCVLDIVRDASKVQSPFLASAPDHIVPALSRVFTWCSEIRVMRDAAAYASLVKLQASMADVAVDILLSSRLQDNVHEWIRVVILEYLAVIRKAGAGSSASSTSGGLSNDGRALAETLHSALTKKLQIGGDPLQRFIDALYGDLCDLIQCCDPLIAQPLTALFKSARLRGGSR